MKKIFLTGKLNAITRAIYNSCAHNFSIQLTSDEPNVVSGMLQILRPDLILVSMVDMDANSKPIIKNISENYKTIPVILIGSPTELEQIKDYTQSEQIQVLSRPIKTSEIIDAIKKTLNMNGAHTEIMDGPDSDEYLQKTILLIDDSAIQLRMMKSLLKKDYKIEMAKTGTAAMTILQNSIPDIIFLDYDMPGQNGKEIFEMIKEYEPTRDVPVVFLTGVKDKKMIQDVLAMEPAAYILKPVEQNKIMDVIHNILEDTSF